MIDTPTYAPWSRRALAYVIDQYLLVPFIALLFLPKDVRLVGFLAIQAFWIWSTIVRQGRSGESVGRQWTNTKLVDENTGEPIGVGRNFIRGLVHTIDFVPLCIGFFRPLWNAKSKTWADEIMHTIVIDTRAQNQGWKPLPTTPSPTREAAGHAEAA